MTATQKPDIRTDTTPHPQNPPLTHLLFGTILIDYPGYELDSAQNNPLIKYLESRLHHEDEPGVINLAEP